jgi:hypothetical protein
MKLALLEFYHPEPTAVRSTEGSVLSVAAVYDRRVAVALRATESRRRLIKKDRHPEPVEGSLTISVPLVFKNRRTECNGYLTAPPPSVRRLPEQCS